jgi:hypothetical protein
MFVMLVPLYLLGQSGAKQKTPAEHKNNETPKAPPTVPIQPPAKQDQGQPEHPSGVPPWTDPFWSNWVLVLVTGVAVWLAKGTLDDLKEQTSATKVSADAAKLSAQAVINAERAWIMVDVDWNNPGNWGGHILYGSDSISLALKICCRNDGRSLAWITEKYICAEMVEALTAKPDFTNPENVVQRQVQPLAASKGDEGRIVKVSCPSQPSLRKQRLFVVYGRVKYRTIFDTQEGETTFGYLLDASDKLVRLAGKWPEYNKNT